MMYIYGLTDPRNGELRYVGATKDMRDRLRCHLKDKCVCHRTKWIKSLGSLGLVPNICLLETVDDDDWQDAEQFWIAQFKSLGLKLVNGTDGGEGSPNPTPEVREKIRLAQSGEKNRNFGKHPSPETLAKLSASRRGEKNHNFGRPLSDKQREQIRAAHLGTTLSPEIRAKMSLAHTGHKHTQEEREKIRVANRGRPKSPETRAKISRAKSGTNNPNYGIPMSAEQKAKIAESNRIAWQTRRLRKQVQQSQLFTE